MLRIGDKNVLFGGDKKIINFSIGSTSYQAEAGMTWKEWVESNYSPVSYYISDGVVYTGETVKGCPEYVYTRGIDVEIIENYVYSFVF